MFQSSIGLNSELSATIIRGDGSSRSCALGEEKLDFKKQLTKLKQPLTGWRRIWAELRGSNVIPITLSFAAFMHWLHNSDAAPFQLALVTTAGVNYLAADFLSSSSSHIAAFNYHDCGTGTTSATIADTTLQTPAGTSRVSGTQSNPSAGQYRSVATISFTSTLAITEFGLFSASTSGTLWDHRVFSPINVSSGDAIQFQYSCTVNAGGS